jgi:hypothetical protein
LATGGAGVVTFLSLLMSLQDGKFDVQPGLVGEDPVVDLAFQHDLDVAVVRGILDGQVADHRRIEGERVAVHLEFNVLDAHDQAAQVVLFRIEDIRDGKYLVGLHVELHKILAGEIFDLVDSHLGVQPQAGGQDESYQQDFNCRFFHFGSFPPLRDLGSL